MKIKPDIHHVILIGIVCGLLLFTTLFAGCTSSTPQSTTPVVTAAPVPAVTSVGTPLATQTTAAPVTTTAPVATTTPKPTFTPSQGTVVAYTAASLTGVSPTLASDFEKMYPGNHVVFNLDGTQALKTQVQNGAYADVFISASNSYTTELTKGGYFVDGTVSPLTSNYVIVILPASNPGNITDPCRSCKARCKDCDGGQDSTGGTATVAVLANLAKSTYNQDWNKSVYQERSNVRNF